MTPPPDNILDYESHIPIARISRFAIVAYIVAFLALISCYLVVTPIIAFTLAVIADRRINRNPAKLVGKAYSKAAIKISFCSFLISLLIVPLGVLGLSKAREHIDRTACAANLRTIMHGMTLYATDNSGQYPTVTYAPYSPALNSPTATATFIDRDNTINAYYSPPYPQAGSVTACLWALLLAGCPAKHFICFTDDPHRLGIPRQLDPAGRYYDNFQSDDQLSYSFAYPWKADGSVGNWWRNTGDPTIPIAADMAPEHGTGTPRRILNPAATPRNRKTWNSANHDGKGQNVVFADIHTEWTIRPTVGQRNDNIWTTSADPSTGPAEFGGIPASKASPNLTADSDPYDIIMYPIRNLDTGRL
ncbi:MAG: hypothetical protein FWD53_03975 [Phycisphaerales bacterium]|nr:hypothetical protein [Phycisphaerales bacterium]